MEKAEVEKASADDGSHLHRNRSFKTKQLVRSQAIRESQSPPRALSPHPASPSPLGKVSPDVPRDDARHSVEIQITSGEDGRTYGAKERRERCNVRTECSNLLSNGPRVACVCVQCSKCRGKRREPPCPIKQDSGIACSDDCPDCAGDGNSDCQKQPLEHETEHVCRCPEKPKNNLSRNDSDDRIDLNGVDLVNFIKSTLNKNPKDRMTLLKIEKELHSLVTDTGRCVTRFPVMTSYGRMLVHRCATLFQLAHHLDQSSKTQVLVSKIGTSGGSIPCTPFKSWCTASFPHDHQRQHADDPTQAKSILKRSAHSLDETGSNASGAAGRSKSLEQRERDYERVRRRIFSSDNCTQDESQWPWLSGPVKLLTPDNGRNRLLKVQSLETPSGSTVRRDRGPVSKSHSFGSYGGEDAPKPRLLSRQGDLASSSWRLSPSSSGYKTLSLRSTDSVTPSPTGGVSPEPQLANTEGALVWAVTDLTAVPPGALIIHPQTCRPVTNPDGSLYQYDPANPPILCDARTNEDKVDQNNEKRRGRLEKQHSFMDNDCECQSTEELKMTCCCDCQKHGGCKTAEKTQEKPEAKSPLPQTPTKTYQPPKEHKYEKPTNQNAQKTEYEQPIRAQNAVTQYEPTNQVAEQKRSPFEQTQYVGNVRPQNQYYANRTTPSQVEEKSYVQNSAPPRPDSETVSPSQTINLQQSQIMQEAQTRHMPLSVYPPPVHPAAVQRTPYPDYRMEPQYQPQLYQQVAPPVEEKHAPQDTTFRIDPSYQYACAAQCGACVDTTAQAHRSVYATQMEATQTVFPVTSVILPQYQMPQYQQIQWQPNLPLQPLINMQPPKPASPYVPDVYPYGYAYPVLQYPYYPVCPVYPVQERKGEEDRCTSGSERCESAKSDSVSAISRQNSNDIALKIQEIKQQMATLSCESERADVRARRNNGNGILGSYPAGNGYPRVGRPPINDESQLSSAARAIVNSIRNIQGKPNHHNSNPRRNADYAQNQTQNHAAQHQNHSQNREFRPERRTEQNARTDGYQNRNRFPRPRPDSADSDPTRRGADRGGRGGQGRREAAGVVRQISPGNWCRRSPGPPFNPAFRNRQPPTEQKPRR